jgi:hypothetical protein
MKTNKIYVLLAIIGTMVAACKKEYKEIGDIPSKVDGITATWVLSSCKSVDKASIVEESLDITTFFYSKNKLPNITFVMEGSLGTYSCDTSNVAYQFFGGTRGTWQFDNNEFPTKVILSPTGSTETIVFPMVGTIRPTDTYLQLDKSVSCGGKETSVYRLSFTRN